MCTTCLLSSSRSQKRAADPLELELRTIVSRHVGTRTQIQALYECSK